MGPHSIVSHGQLHYTDRMSYWQRALNMFYTIFENQQRHMFHLETQNEIARRHFFNLDTLPWLEDIIANNVSLVMTYSHRAIFSPRPALPNMINIGGAHITKPQKLPADIQKFLDGAVHGAIYFSLGTVLRSEHMPSNKMNMFLGTFCVSVIIFHFSLDIFVLNKFVVILIFRCFPKY